MKLAVFFLVLGQAVASLRKPSRMSEVEDVRNIMEKIRESTEGAGRKIPTATVALPAEKRKLQAGEHFEGEFDLDNFLLAQADKTTELLNEVDKLEDPVEQRKKASLAKISSSKETSASRAARFFAAHGMSKVAHMLGKDFVLSSAAEKEVVAEHKVALAKLDKRTPAEPAPNSHSSEVEDIDLPDDDENEVKEREHWAAVDALKKRRPPTI